MIHQQHLDVGERDERPDEGPGAGHVEILGRGARVPARSVEVVVADVDVASGLVAEVRAQVASAPFADVSDRERGSPGKVGCDLVDCRFQVADRLLGAPGLPRRDHGPGVTGKHRRCVEQEPGARLADGHRPQSRGLSEKALLDLRVADGLERVRRRNGGVRRGFDVERIVDRSLAALLVLAHRVVGLGVGMARSARLRKGPTACCLSEGGSRLVANAFSRGLRQSAWSHGRRAAAEEQRGNGGGSARSPGDHRPRTMPLVCRFAKRTWHRTPPLGMAYALPIDDAHPRKPRCARSRDR